jgi:18S rRNA (adenine1779-N6/adenine1780-N6)-dimethyltransferase
MGKIIKGKASAAPKSTQNQVRAANPLFNKDLGQHILKNPMVAQGIVDKVIIIPYPSEIFINLHS